jgi:DNA-binding CsgD family transcriptional regulator
MLGQCPVLLERDEESRSMSALAAQVAAGGGPQAVVVTGPAGIGKSRLAREFLASLPEPWVTATARLSPTRVLLSELPPQRPLALVVDDAHFLDPGQLDLLPDLLEGLGADPVALLLTWRLGHRGDDVTLRALARLVRAPRVHELRLGPLSPGGVERMAAAMGKYAPGDLYARTGGNPFWTEELLRGGDQVPWTVVEAVAAQLETLPEPAQALARLLAVVDEPLPARAASRLIDELDAAFGALAAAGFASEAGGALAMRHALVAEAVTSTLGPIKRAALHRRLATVAEAEGGDPARIARHWAAAGESNRAGPPARQAAAGLRGQGAHRRALEYYRLALADPLDSSLEAAELYETAAITAALVGEFSDARAWVTAAQEAYRGGGAPGRAVRVLLDPAFGYLPWLRPSDRLDDEPVERLLAEAQAAMRRNDVDGARDRIERAALLAREQGDGMALVRTASQVLFALGEFGRGERLLEEAKGLPDVRAHPIREARVLTTLGRSRLAQGYVVEAVELQRHAADVARRDPDSASWTGRMALGHTLALAGEIDEGADALLEAATLLPRMDAMATMVDGYRRFERGEIDAGLARMLEGSERLFAEIDFDPLFRAVVASRILGLRALAEALGGHATEALRTLRRVDELCPEPFNDMAATLVYALARAAADVGDAGLAAEARCRAHDLARQTAGPGVIGVAEAVAGCAARLSGDHAAARHFQAAAGLLERAPRAVLAAECWCDAAAELPSRAAAAAALRRARALCERHVLTRVAARIEATERAIAAAGVQVPPLLAELTSREREVVALAAEGLSNREIGARLYLSEGTARNYLSTAFAKLGVSRRSQLAGKTGGVPLGLAR